MESVIERKNNSLLVVILLLLLIGVSGYVVYDKFIKKDVGTSVKQNSEEVANTNLQEQEPCECTDTTPQKQDSLTNDLAIALAKEKVGQASLYLADSTRYRGEQYSEEGYGQLFYEYKPLDEFKKEFYSIYSSKLSYKDVLGEQNLSVDKKNASDGVSTSLKIDKDDDSLDMHLYAIKNNYVYIMGCTGGGEIFSRMNNFSIKSITSNEIKVNYGAYFFDEITDKEYKRDDGAATLVKENGEWRILSATVVGKCSGTYKVGK